MRLLTVAVYVCALSVCVAPAWAQEAEAPSDDNLSLQEIQELLDRFSDTTMKSIERQLRKKVDAYEESLDRAEAGGGDEEAAETYRLVFSLPVTGDMSVLSSGGQYSLTSEQETRDRREKGQTDERHMLTCEGSVEQLSPERVHITFSGSASYGTDAGTESGTVMEGASVNFSGSAVLPLGQKYEIARNDHLSVFLTVESAAPVEKGIPPR